MNKKLSLTLVALAFTGIIGSAPLMAERKLTEAEIELRGLNEGLQPVFQEITEGVYVASGYGVSNISFIVGEDGIVVIDAGILPVFTAQALAEFRKHNDFPIKHILFTHGHGDHTGGASALVELDNEGEIEVWAHEKFGAERKAFSSSGITIDAVRGRRQAGFLLPDELRINNGIAAAVRPRKTQNVFQPDKKGVAPAKFVNAPRTTLELSGVTLELVEAPGETADQLYIWYPEKGVLFSGDNFYRSWPNLYAIRGTPYRDVKAWAEAVDMMLSEEPTHLVPGHTLPISGPMDVSQALSDYRDGIQFVFDKTIEGINQGMTPDQLVGYVQLPQELLSSPYLQPYYGNPEWAVRAIFSGYLGWFDGNPTNLHALATYDRASRIVDLAGGPNRVFEKAKEALIVGDAQWAAELSDLLIQGDQLAQQAKLLKADALEYLGRNTITALARNYYLTVAQELRKQAKAAKD